MITIQGFARLCGCNTQTLRYYDRIGLLTPAKVDEWTGYRYYEEKQALRFVKIKNLQQADFSIEEIRPLLEADDLQLAEAFERKIREQQQKLERIREIQRSYLKETMDMQKMVLTITDFVEEQIGNPVLWKEFGLDDARETEISARVHEMLADWLAQCRNAGGEIAESMNSETMATMKEMAEQTAGSGREQPASGGDRDIPTDAEKVFERHGWEHVSEWIGELPDLGDGKQNYFLFRVCEDSPVSGTGFPMMMLAVAAVRCNAMNGGMYCNTVRSSDGQNHFELYRR